MPTEILVVGDIILDAYVKGTASKLSPEAPVPVIDIDERNTTYSLGGAANVAANIKALGGNPILVGIISKEFHSYKIDKLLEEAGISGAHLHRSEYRRTSVKTRIFANGAQVTRLDSEDKDALDYYSSQAIREAAKKYCSNTAAIVISDYAKGVVTSDVMRIFYQNKDLSIFIDPKPGNNMKYQDRFSVAATTFTPNLHEAESMVGFSGDVKAIGECLLTTLGVSNLLITMGSGGLALFQYGISGMIAIPTAARAVFDVSGAGDTVIATLALANSRGLRMPDAARLANLAAGIVVGKSGTATVSYDELLKVSLDAGILALPSK